MNPITSPGADTRWQPGGQFYEQFYGSGRNSNAGSGATPSSSSPYNPNNINGGAVGINNSSTTNVPKYSPAVISDSTIREQTIPNLISKANTLTGDRKSPDQQRALGYKYDIYTGQSLDNTNQNVSGNNNQNTSTNNNASTNATPNLYDSLLDPYKKLLSDSENDPIYNSELELIKKMGANIDASSASQMANITSKYAEREAAMKDSQGRETKGIENALNLGGSARYAPVSSSGILTEKEKYDMKALSGLQDEEQTLKSGIVSAQQDKNYQLMGSQIQLMEGKRKEKNDIMATLTEKMAARNAQILADNKKTSREQSIVNLYKQGVTDPMHMFDYLNYDKNGKATGDISLAEIGDALDKLKKTDDTQGDVRQFLDAKKNGLIDKTMSYFDYQQKLAASKESPLDTTIKNLNIKKAQQDLADTGGVSKTLKDSIDLESKFGDEYRKRDEVQRLSVTADALHTSKSLIGNKDISKLTLDDVKALNLQGSDADTISMQIARARNPDTARAADNGDVNAAESINQIYTQTRNGLISGDKVLPDKVLSTLKTLQNVYNSRETDIQKVNKEFKDRAGRAKITVPGIIGDKNSVRLQDSKTGEIRVFDNLSEADLADAQSKGFKLIQ